MLQPCFNIKVKPHYQTYSNEQLQFKYKLIIITELREQRFAFFVTSPVGQIAIFLPVFSKIVTNTANTKTPMRQDI